jgi:hypothetical protein
MTLPGQTPIGANKIDKWFFSIVDQTALNLIVGAPDIDNKAFIWIFRSIYAPTATQDQAITTPEQIQDVVVGTLHAVIDSGHVAPGIGLPPMGQPQQEPPPQAPPLDPNKAMMEDSKHALQEKQHVHERAMAEMQAQQQPAGDGQ